MMTGYVKIYRKIFDNPVLEDPEFSRRDAWIWLIAHATWCDRRVRVEGTPVNLKRGQLAHSIRFMASAWGWSKSRVDRFLCHLREDEMIETDAGTGRTIITICNYSLFHGRDDGAGTPSGTPAGHQRDNNKNLNNYTLPRCPGFMPDDFPWPEHVEYAEMVWKGKGLDIDPAPVAARFKNHHATRARMSDDWSVEWMRWVANERGPRAEGHSKPQADPWHMRLTEFKKSGFWLPDQWGPPPDDADFKRKQPQTVVALWETIGRDVAC